VYEGTGGCAGVDRVPVAIFDGISCGRGRVIELAYETGAFARARKIESPEVLLQLILDVGRLGSGL